MKKILIYVYLLIMLFFVTSCSLDTDNTENDGKKTNLIIIAGSHSNSKKMDVEEDLAKKVKGIYSNFGKIRVIVVDGKPEMAIGSDNMKIGEFEEEYLRKSKETKKRNHRIWERDYLTKQTQFFLEEFKKLEPDDPEVDTLGAIFKAVGTLNDISEDEDDKEIIIYDTGLCTSGEFSFSNKKWKDMLFCDEGLEDERIQDFVKDLEHKDLIPKLSGIKIAWHGIGETAGIQGELNKRYITNLTKMWQGILTASEAVPLGESEQFDYFFSGSCYDETNYSQMVTPITKDKKKDNEGNPTGEILPITIPVKKLGFKRESSKFVSEEKAIKVLKPYAEKIKNYSDGNILLIGTTADPKRNGGSRKLSEKRAEKVKEYLVKLGVSANRMKIYGWGARSSLYDPGEWVGNNFNEKVAKKNRAVHIMPEGSEYAKNLLRQKHP